jgi:hypothetical protein
MPSCRVCGVAGFVRSNSPLRRRSFCGGCSWVEYQRIAAACLSLVFSTDGSPFGGLVLERCGWGMRGLVFGTLLGPEATGPRAGPLLWGLVCGFVCFWFPGCTDRMY